MTLQERTRQILDALATAQEQLNEYAVDLWISADRADERGIQTAADAQKALLKAAREFATVAASIDATIRSHYAAVTELPAAGLDEADVVDTSQADDEVDPTGQHLSLTMDWTHKRPTAARLGDARRQSVNTWKAVYRWVLQQLYTRNTALFATLPDRPIAMTRRNRILFSRDGKGMLSPIEVMGVYAESNYSANDLRDRMGELFEIFGVDGAGFSVQLRGE